MSVPFLNFGLAVGVPLPPSTGNHMMRSCDRKNGIFYLGSTSAFDWMARAEDSPFQNTRPYLIWKILHHIS